MMKAVLYARVSSKEQEREGFSIPAQIALLYEYANRHNIEIVEEFVEAQTAKTTGREEFGRMIEHLKRKTSPVVLLVEKTDRLYRNFKDFLQIDELISEYGIHVHLVKEGEVLSKDSTSHTKLIHGIKVVLAKNYIDNLSEETKKGHLQKVQQGGWISMAPYGYKMVKGDLQINEATAPFVREVFRLYSTGRYSLDVLRDEMKERGFFYRAYMPKIPKSALGRMLKASVYIGEIEYKGKTYSGNHQPLIDRETWHKVQWALKGKGKPERYQKHSFAYSGAMFCGECGKVLSGELKKNGKYVYYRCSDLKKNCSQGYISETKIENQFRYLLEKLSIPPEIQRPVREALREMDEIMIETSQREDARLTQERGNLKTYLRRLYQDKVEGLVDRDTYLEMQAGYQEQIQIIEEKLSNVTKADFSYMETSDRLFELTNHFAGYWSWANPEEKRVLLNLVCSNFYVKDGKIDVLFKDAFSFREKVLKRENGAPDIAELRKWIEENHGSVFQISKMIA